MSKQSLSKGTLGLKFMNRTTPGASPSSSSAPSPAPAAPVPPPKSVNLNSNTSGSEPRSHQPSTTPFKPTIIHETSYLSFPLLSTSISTTTASSSDATFTNASYYSSMPLTTTAISGRRSFGGANIEIEKLNDPNSHQVQSNSKGERRGDGNQESKSSLKKKQRQLPISGRRTDLNPPKKRTSDVATLASNLKKPRASSGGGDQFEKPRGFEGAKLGSTSASSTMKRDKGKGKLTKGGLMDDDAHEWGARGTTREWDRGKETDLELGSDEEDQRILDEIDQDDEDDDEDEEDEDDVTGDEEEEEIRQMLVKAKAVDRERQRRVRQQDIDKQLNQREQSMMAEPRARASKMDNKSKDVVAKKGKGRT
ncbi:uncharacterized protein JCM15063_004554 [Sporobolomyces koalae]|uniref:uncharacterized protein n=1 Tax=Sporobolomyces koalae TaxID=500713 RepID=UPI003172C6B0